MRVFFDTSVLVAAMIPAHPRHEVALPWLRDAIAGRFVFLISGHTLLELYSVLTTLPVKPRIDPETARKLIHENVESNATIAMLDASQYAYILDDLAAQGISGGCVYDAAIARLASTSEATYLLTLNAKDFRRVWPGGHGIIRGLA
ncbi:MAG: PIN domain-containing protein [Candidatus Schekmanbacteria bacterium]|nr:PIN domain-containing protein [Candidatus Schekmanbacteria bacterium]